MTPADASQSNEGEKRISDLESCLSRMKLDHDQVQELYLRLLVQYEEACATSRRLDLEKKEAMEAKMDLYQQYMLAEQQLIQAEERIKHLNDRIALSEAQYRTVLVENTAKDQIIAELQSLQNTSKERTSTDTNDPATDPLRLDEIESNPIQTDESEALEELKAALVAKDKEIEQLKRTHTGEINASQEIFAELEYENAELALLLKDWSDKKQLLAKYIPYLEKLAHSPPTKSN